MSASSFKPLPTLQGLFTEKKVHHRRNFVRENKLSLREKPSLNRLEKVEKAKKEKEQNARIQHARIQENYQRKRSSSLVQNRDLCKLPNGSSTLDLGESITREFPNLSLKPLKSKGGVYAYDVKEANPSHTTIMSQRSRKSLHDQQSFIVPSRSTATPEPNSVRDSKSRHSVSKDVQTEDITDADFLINALEKCNNNNEVKTIHENHDFHLRNNESDMNISLSNRAQPKDSVEYQQEENYFDSGAENHQLMAPPSGRSNFSQNVNFGNDGGIPVEMSHRSIAASHRSKAVSQHPNEIADNRTLGSQHSSRLNAFGNGDGTNNAVPPD